MITAADKSEVETKNPGTLLDAPVEPQTSSDWNDRGVRLCQSGRVDEAAESFKKACQADKQNFVALENLIELFIRSGKHDHPAAGLAAQWWTRSRPRCANAWIALAKLNLLAGKRAFAKKALARALEIDPANAAVQSALECLEGAKGERAAHGAWLAGSAPCKICGSRAREIFSVPKSKLTGHPFPDAPNDCPYYECPSCRFVFANATDDRAQDEVYDEEYWTKQDPDWHGRVSETLRLLMLANQLLSRNPWELDVLDFGCGMGCSVETLRKLHVPCWGTDLIEPRFGREFFLRDVGEKKFDIIMATEVVEHFTTPMETFGFVMSLLKPNGVFAFQTAIYDRAGGRDWWYVGPANGHVSLYSPQAFDFMKTHFGVAKSLVWNRYCGINAWQVGPDHGLELRGAASDRACAQAAASAD